MVLTTESLSDAHRRKWGGSSADVKVYRAPGRVNLIGEHTDYTEGFVLPIALDLTCYVTRSKNASGELRVVSENNGQERRWPSSALPVVQPMGDWSDYIVGVAKELFRAGYPVEPANLRVHSTIPMGAGLSSSAAIEVATALALLDGRAIPALDLIQLCRRAENRFVGTPCGVMDQYVCVKAEAVPSPGKIAVLKAGLSVPVLTGLGALYGFFDLERGSDGFNTGFAFPEVLLALVARTQAGDLEGAYAIFRRYLPLMVFEQQPGLAVRKEILRRRGLIGCGRVRAPGGNIDSGTAAQLEKLLERSFPGQDLTKPVLVDEN